MDQSRERTCDLRLLLFRWGSVETSYDAKAGLRRSLDVFGHVDDPYIPGCGDTTASHFHDKAVRLGIHLRNDDTEWLTNIRAKHGVAHACGNVLVRTGVEPEQFESDGKTNELEPIGIDVEVGLDTFEAIRSQAAHPHSGMMGATVTLVGNGLPEPNEDSLYLYLKDLDVSAERTYAVGTFKISSAEGQPPRPLPVEGYGGANISILLTGARYDLHTAWDPVLHAIRCEGFVDPRYGNAKSYDRADVSVTFEGWKIRELRDRRFFGEFSYWPKRSDRDARADSGRIHL
jgi:hypothetical protein